MNRKQVLLSGCRVGLLFALGSVATAQQAAGPHVFNDPDTPVAAPSTAQSAGEQSPAPTEVHAPAATLPDAARTSTGSRAVQAIPLNQPSAARLEARKDNYSLKVTGADWVDTHLIVAPGDTITVTAKGEVTLADGRKVTADGVTRGWKDLLRQFPDNSSPAGALVARIGSDKVI